VVLRASAAGPRRRGCSVLVPHAADDDAVLFHRDLDGAMSGPVLGVDGVVLDGRVKPQAVALLAVVEGALQRRRCARARPPSASATAAAAAGARRLGVLLVVLLLAVAVRGGLGGKPLGLGLGGLQLGCDQRVILGAKVDLVRVVRRGGTPSGTSSSLTSSFWRLNCSMSRTDTSS